MFTIFWKHCFKRSVTVSHLVLVSVDINWLTDEKRLGVHEGHGRCLLHFDHDAVANLTSRENTQWAGKIGVQVKRALIPMTSGCQKTKLSFTCEKTTKSTRSTNEIFSYDAPKSKLSLFPALSFSPSRNQLLRKSWDLDKDSAHVLRLFQSRVSTFSTAASSRLLCNKTRVTLFQKSSQVSHLLSKQPWQRWWLVDATTPWKHWSTFRQEDRPSRCEQPPSRQHWHPPRRSPRCPCSKAVRCRPKTSPPHFSLQSCLQKAWRKAE